MPIDFDAMVRFAQSLVQIKSLSGEEKPAIDFIAGEMARLGFASISTDAYGNLVGVIEGDHAGPTVMFDAHVDTVGIAPGVDWQYGPFDAEIRDSRLYGRGSADMKGSLAAMLYAAAAADRSRLAGRILFSASVMEEVVEGLLLEPVITRFQPDGVVIGESTDLRLVHGGRGRAEIHLEAIGRPAHSSSPQIGKNAVLMMMEAVRAIEALSLPADPLMGPAIMALTDIISEPYPGHSMIPSRCRVTYDRRTLPGETAEGVLKTLGDVPALKSIRKKIGEAHYTTYTGAEIRASKFFPAWKLDPGHAFVQSALAGLSSSGLRPESGVFQFCTNAAYTAGVLGIPTVGFGPSPENRAHIVDEYIDLDDLRAAAQGCLGMMYSILKNG